MVGAGIIAIGVLSSHWLFITQRSAGFNSVRLRLATYLALALEFQLGADILSTAIAPTGDKIGKLGAIAIIRTALNYFLMQEMSHERHIEKSPPRNVPFPHRPCAEPPRNATIKKRPQPSIAPPQIKNTCYTASDE